MIHTVTDTLHINIKRKNLKRDIIHRQCLTNLLMEMFSFHVEMDCSPIYNLLQLLFL